MCECCGREISALPDLPRGLARDCLGNIIEDPGGTLGMITDPQNPDGPKISWAALDRRRERYEAWKKGENPSWFISAQSSTKEESDIPV